ncbi:MAG: hypothetical protein AAGC83_14300 [Pseudomonadota bacterium]
MANSPNNAEARTDKGYLDMLEERERVYGSSWTFATRVTILVCLILLGMFFFLV